MPWAQPCTAHRRDGKIRGAYAIRGGGVCRMHGGAAPQVRHAAQRGLFEERDRRHRERWARMNPHTWAEIIAGIPPSRTLPATGLCQKSFGKRDRGQGGHRLGPEHSRVTVAFFPSWTPFWRPTPPIVSSTNRGNSTPKHPVATSLPVELVAPDGGRGHEAVAAAPQDQELAVREERVPAAEERVARVGEEGGLCDPIPLSRPREAGCSSGDARSAPHPAPGGLRRPAHL